MKNFTIQSSQRCFISISAVAVLVAIFCFKSVAYAQAPDFLWAKRAGGTGCNDGSGIAIDPSNNIIVTGKFEGTATFDTITLMSVGHAHFFIAKYDPSGNVLWAKRAGGINYDQGFGIATDNSGNCIVV